MKKLIRCTIVVEEADFEVLSGVLALHITFGWQEESLPTGETRVLVHSESKEFMDALAAGVREFLPQAQIFCEEIEQEDWTLAWREYFTPIACGTRFLVLPPWLKESENTQGRIPIIIEPKSAFGTGHHATTALCLRVISDLLDSGRLQPQMRFLDLGTGSGILGIGCCLAGLTGVGADIDMLAVENTLENRRLNNVSGFDILAGSVEQIQGQHFDVVIANILAQPLRELAVDLVQLVRLKEQNGTQGCLILSGLLLIQAESVEQAYMAQSLGAPRRVVQGEWACLVWE